MCGLSFTSGLLASCISATNDKTLSPQLDQPAIISYPGKASSLVVAKAIKNLTGTQVQLSENVFADSSYLLIQKHQLLGLDLDEVDRYDLVIHDNSCVLIYVETKARQPMPELNCIPFFTD